MPILSIESVPISSDQIKNCYDSRTNKTVTMKLWTSEPYASLTMNIAYDYEHCLRL